MPKKLRTLNIWSVEYPPEGGGTGVVAKQMCAIFSKKKSVDLTLITKSRSSLLKEAYWKTEEARGHKIIWVVHLMIKMVFKTGDIHIINCPISMTLAGICFSKKKLGKAIFLLHGSEIRFLFNSPLMKIWSYVFLSRLINYSKGFVCHGQDYRQRTIKTFKNKSVKFNDQKITYSYFGYDNIVFNDSVESFNIKKFHNVNDDELVVISASRIIIEKGYNEIVKTLTKVKQKNKKFKWFVAGDGPYLPELREKVKQFNLNSETIFLGNISPVKLASYYRASDLYYLPSTYPESFGLTFAEAQACGLQVIGKNNYGLKESILPSNGWLIDQHNEATDLIMNLTKKKLPTASIFSRFSTEIVLGQFYERFLR